MWSLHAADVQVPDFSTLQAALQNFATGCASAEQHCCLSGLPSCIHTRKMGEHHATAEVFFSHQEPLMRLGTRNLL